MGAAGSHGAAFSDVDEDSVHADNINCIAYYGITLGKGDGLYGPDEHVTAFQMRLFVQRAADLMGANGEKVLEGVELSDPVTRLEMAQLMFGLVLDIDDDVRINPRDGQIEFWDLDKNDWVVVDDYFADVKASEPIADSQIVGAAYELGITRGTRGDGTRVSTPDSKFEPSANVTRAQMASFIARTLDHSNLRPEGLSFQHNSRGDTMISYRDARDTDFEPIPNERIDVLSTLYVEDAFDDDGECSLRFVKDETPSHSTCEIDIGDQATDDEGNIEFTPVSLAGDPIVAACLTDGTVNYEFADSGSEGRTYWAWAGSLGDEVGRDTDLQELESVDRPVGSAGPDYARISGGLPTDDEIAKMGETVTFTVQLRADTGANGRDDSDGLIDDVAAGPDRSRNPYHLRIQKFYVDANGESDSDADSTTGNANTDFPEAPGDWDYISLTTANTASPTAATDAAGALFQTETDTLVWPNGDGELLIHLRNSDPQAGRNNTDVAVKFTLTPFVQGTDLITGNLLSNIVVDDDTNDASVAQVGTIDQATGYAIFADDPSDAHSVSADGGEYRTIAGSRTGNSVTVKVLDQYGDPMRGVEINVTSSIDNATEADDNATYPEEVDITVQTTEGGTDLAPTEPLVSGTASPIRAFRTRSNGAYRIGYNYTDDEALTETITPRVIQTERPDPASGSNVVTRAAEAGEAASVYWAKIGTSFTSTFGGSLVFAPVLVRDVASRTIVVHERDVTDTSTDEPAAYYYDEDDTFIIENVGATFEMFEEVLSLSLADGDPCEVDAVQWENYSLTLAQNARPGRVDRTIWKLSLTNSSS